MLVWGSTFLPRLPLPLPVHFGILAGLCMFVLLPVMPYHPMAIPTVIGGGLAGALLLVDRRVEQPQEE